MSCSWHGETPRDKGEKLPRIVKEKTQCFGPEHETWKKNLHVFGVLMTILCINLVRPSFLVVATGVAWCQRQPHPVGAANSLRFPYFVMQNLDLLNWVGWKKWDKYSPKGGNKWWFTRICKTKITNSTKEKWIFHQISLGTKISHPRTAPKKFVFLVTVGTLKEPPKKMLTNYNVLIETWACPKHFTYNAFFVDLFDAFIHVIHRPLFHLLSAGVKDRNSSTPPFSSPERHPWKTIWSMKQNLVIWVL